MMRNRRFHMQTAAIAVFLLLPLLPAGTDRCLAADAVAVDIGSVYASNEGSSIDPALGTLREKLLSMFRYSSYKVLDRKRRTLAVGEAGEFELPGGRSLRVKPLPAEGSKVRLHLRLKEGEKKLLGTTVGLSRGGMVLVGGTPYEGGVLILVISAN